MRGVVSAGMVSALEQLGLRDCFDEVYGSSAGSITGAYFIANQARFGTTIFYNEINNSHFIDLARVVSSKPIVSLSYLLDEVCRTKVPLSVPAVLESDIPLKIISASVERREAAVLGNFRDADELFTAMRASANIPYFAGSPVLFRGEHYLDASLYASIPFAQAMLNNPTDLVVLMTRPKGQKRSDPNWIDKLVVAPQLRRIDPQLASHYLSRAAEYQKELDYITQGSQRESGPNILPIQTAVGTHKISPFEKSREKLVSAAISGFAAVYDALGRPHSRIAEIITVYD